MPTAPPPRAAAATLAAGVVAALHVGKLAPALPALQAELGLSLLQAGFALSGVQLAGMLLGLAFGAWSDGLGARRSIALGLLLLAAASAGGAMADGAAALLAWRAAEGLGFLFVVLAAPGLLRGVVAPSSSAFVLGLWGAYMPLATALALLLGPAVLHAAGWRAWWAGLALLTGACAAFFVHALRGAPAAARGGGPVRLGAWWGRVRATLAAAGPWLVAMCFASYSAQWLAVIGFLPSIYAEAGWVGGGAVVAMAAAAAANIGGNLAAGRALQAGVAPVRLLTLGFVAMAFGALVAFGASGAPAALRYGAVLVFSGIGGLIPATLFALAVRLAPAPQAVGTTVGWVQQWSALGQFAGPPAVAAVAGAAGGWRFTGVATAAAALIGLVLVALLHRRLAREG